MRRKKLTSLETALEHIYFPQEAKNYDIYLFLRKVIAQKYKISLRCLECSRDYRIVEARMILFCLLKNNTTYNYRMMAYLFSIRNHSRIHHGVKLIKDYLNKNLYKDTVLAVYKEMEYSLREYLKGKVNQSI